MGGDGGRDVCPAKTTIEDSSPTIIPHARPRTSLPFRSLCLDFPFILHTDTARFYHTLRPLDHFYFFSQEPPVLDYVSLGPDRSSCDHVQKTKDRFPDLRPVLLFFLSIDTASRGNLQPNTTTTRQPDQASQKWSLPLSRPSPPLCSPSPWLGLR